MLSQLYPQDWTRYLEISGIFLRMLGMFLLAPAFNHRSIPVSIKIVLAFSLSLALYPVVQRFLNPFPMDFFGLILMAFKETAIGILLGLGIHLVVESIHTAAQFIGFQMGFGVGGLMDPQMQSSVTVLVPLYGWVVLMLFFVLNLHHELLTLFVSSFRITQKIDGNFLENTSAMNLVIQLFGDLFVVAVRMAAPFTLLALISNLAVGVLNRFIPQMNVMLFSFPVTILLGLITFYFVSPELLNFVENLMSEASDRTVNLLRKL